MDNKKIIFGVLKAILLLLLAYIAFKLAYPIANSIVQIERGPELLIKIWYLAPLWGLVFILIGAVGSFGSWSILVYFLDRLFLTEEKKNIWSTQEKTSFKKKPFSSYILIAAGGTSITVILAIVLFISYIGYLGSQLPKEKHSWSSRIKFSEKHNVKIPDDDRVSFYISELQASTQKFVNAESNYDIFQFDVRREMAFYCLRKVYSKSETLTTNEPLKIRENILNNYVTTNHLQNKARNSLEYVRNSMSDYPLASGYGAFKLDKKYPDRCNNLMTVEEMYQLHIPSYLIAKKKQLSNLKSNFKAKRKILELLSNIENNFG